MRKFYLAYRDRISETTYRKFALEKSVSCLFQFKIVNSVDEFVGKKIVNTVERFVRKQNISTTAEI